MTRRKLCVVCMSGDGAFRYRLLGSEEAPRLCEHCYKNADRQVFITGSQYVEWASRRARAFERKRWKAKGTAKAP